MVGARIQPIRQLRLVFRTHEVDPPPRLIQRWGVCFFVAKNGCLSLIQPMANFKILATAHGLWLSKFRLASYWMKKDWLHQN